MKKYWVLFALGALFFNSASAQKDTLVYYLSSTGELAASRQAAASRLVIFPVGSGSEPKLSPIKGINLHGKLLFTGFSATHGFPIKIEGMFIEYYPDGIKMSVKSYSKGAEVGDKIEYYSNGNIKSSVHLTADGDADKKKYYENGRLSFEHTVTGKKSFNEIFYSANGKIKRKVIDDSIGAIEWTDYFDSGKPSMTESFDKDHQKEVVTAYFPNGNLYYREQRGLDDNNVPYVQYIECRDSTGKELVQNGNGYWAEFDESFTFKSRWGKVIKGRPDSIWKILYVPGEGQYETYKKGKLVDFEVFEKKDTPASPGYRAPEFPGGDKSLNEFLQRNTIYPAIALENRVSGRVILGFTVEKNGTLSNIRVITGIGDGCDDEALRVIKLSPPWIPGKKGNITDSVNYAIRINFFINGNTNNAVVSLGDFQPMQVVNGQY